MVHRAGDPRRFLEGGSFGAEPGVWAAEADDDPAEVAAAFVQHRLIAQLRQRFPARFGGELGPRVLAEATGDAERSVQRRLTGRGVVTLRDLIAWSGVGGIDVGGLFEPDGRLPLPSGVPALEPGWSPGAWRPPRFQVPPDPTGGRWAAVCAAVAEQLEAEHAEGRLGLVTAPVVIHWVIGELTRLGIAPSDLFLDAERSGIRAPLLIGTRPESVLAAATALNILEGTPHELVELALRTVVDSAWDMANFPIARRFLCVGMRASFATRLDTLSPGTGTASVGDAFMLRLSDLEGLAPVGMTVDLALSCVGAVNYDAFTVATFEVEKASDFASSGDED